MPWLRREALLFLPLVGFGLLVLPALVYLVGQVLLGEYLPGATMATFYGDLYGHLAGFSPWPWLLVLGPWLAVQLLRLLWLPLRPLTRHRRRHRGEDPPRDTPASSAERIEPTI